MFGTYEWYSIFSFPGQLDFPFLSQRLNIQIYSLIDLKAFFFFIWTIYLFENWVIFDIRVVLI